jgi:hypothetical protein
MSDKSPPVGSKPADQPAKSLWPKKFGVDKLRSPVSILREQAALLGEATQNIVIASVSTDPRNEVLSHNFMLVAPGLGNYKVLLFSANHKPIEIYPLTIYSEILAPADKNYVQYVAKNEGEFLGNLKTVFSLPKTTQIIESLLAQSEGYDPGAAPF